MYIGCCVHHCDMFHLHTGLFVGSRGYVLFPSFRSVKESDEGAFVCRAQNEGGVTEETVWLIIQSEHTSYLHMHVFYCIALYIDTASMLMSVLKLGHEFDTNRDGNPRWISASWHVDLRPMIWSTFPVELPCYQYRSTPVPRSTLCFPGSPVPLLPRCPKVLVTPVPRSTLCYPAASECPLLPRSALCYSLLPCSSPLLSLSALCCPGAPEYPLLPRGALCYPGVPYVTPEPHADAPPTAMSRGPDRDGASRVAGLRRRQHRQHHVHVARLPAADIRLEAGRQGGADHDEGAVRHGGRHRPDGADEGGRRRVRVWGDELGRHRQRHRHALLQRSVSSPPSSTEVSAIVTLSYRGQCHLHPLVQRSAPSPRSPTEVSVISTL